MDVNTFPRPACRGVNAPVLRELGQVLGDGVRVRKAVSGTSSIDAVRDQAAACRRLDRFQDFDDSNASWRHASVRPERLRQPVTARDEPAPPARDVAVGAP